MTVPVQPQPTGFPVIPGLDLKRVIGSGGFARVYEAYEARQDRLVAVKVLRSEGLTRERLLRVERESMVMGKLSDHPSIVDIFRSDTTEDGRPYLVMKYYTGGHYGQRAAGGMRESDVLRVGVLISSALESAHRYGVLHRDIKPENILIDRFGIPGLTDFGIASDDKARDDDGAMTIAYAAPELMLGSAPPSRVTDVYSLGATLWALLTGAPPYPGPIDEFAIDMMRRILQSPVPRLSRAGVHPRLEQLLREALDHDPNARPQSAVEFGAALQRVEQDLGMVPTDLLILEDEKSTGWREPTAHGDRTVGGADTAGREASTDAPKGTKLTRVQPRPELRDQADEIDAPEPRSEVGPATTMRKVLVGAAIGVLVVVALGIGLSLGGGGDDQGRTAPTVLVAETEVLDVPVRVPTLRDGMSRVELTSETFAEVYFEIEDAQEGDEVQVVLVGGAEEDSWFGDTSPIKVGVPVGNPTPCYEIIPRSLSRISTNPLTVCASP